MPTVALVGPDGAGKTTVALAVQRELELPTVYLYMGVNFESGNRVLPTSRLIRWMRKKGGVRKNTAAAPPNGAGRGHGRGPLKALRSLLRLLNRLAEESYRQLLTWKYCRAGRVVIFDRHFFADFYATDVSGARRDRWSDRVHGLFLSHVYPKPDLVVYLDAPAEVLFARKREGTLESLAAQKRSYESLAAVAPRFVRIDADRPLGVVVAEIAQVIREFVAESGGPQSKKGLRAARVAGTEG